jgi:hypothetical protein
MSAAIAVLLLMLEHVNSASGIAMPRPVAKTGRKGARDHLRLAPPDFAP